jgi:hypothetical protein
MPSARFTVTVDGPGPANQVTFLLGANPGEPLQPLAKVASGGRAGPHHAGHPPGHRRRTRGAGLRRGRRRGRGRRGHRRRGRAGRTRRHAQVLVVTHLAQVAAQADHQIEVRKAERTGPHPVRGDRARHEDRVTELSRMLSGRPDSASARRHARELLGEPVGQTGLTVRVMTPPTRWVPPVADGRRRRTRRRRSAPTDRPVPLASSGARRGRKFIFVTGGVSSSLGKGLTASSLGRLLKCRGLRVTMCKLDPYINVDPGTMNPFEHGEVFVTEDGGETDLDLGHYERFIDENLHKLQRHHRVGSTARSSPRSGAATTWARRSRSSPTSPTRSRSGSASSATDDVDVVIVEIGGTVGDIEIVPFIEAIRQFRHDVGRDNVCYVHLTLVPYLARRASRRPSPPSTRSPSCAAAGSSPTSSCAARTNPSPRT